MTTDDPLSDDELALFRESVGSVKPIRADDRVQFRNPPAARARQREADDRLVLAEMLHGPLDVSSIETGEELLFLRSHLKPKILTKLRRGEYSIGGELDLHSMNAAAAQKSIVEFIAEAQLENIRAVKIIHGKGLRSKHRGPILKRLTASVLMRMKSVMAFASARPNDGGTGAVYVLLTSATYRNPRR